MSALADLLESRAEDLARRWADRPGPGPGGARAAPVLLDPAGVVRELASALRGSPPAAPAAGPGQAPPRHREGFDLDALQREVVGLHHLLLDVAAESGVELTLAERHAAVDFFAGALIEGARAHGHQTRQSEERYRTLFASIDDAFCLLELIVDAQGQVVDYRFLEANAAFETQSGLAGVVGKRVRELLPDLDGSWFAFYGRVLATGEAARFEGRSVAMDRWFDAYASPMGPPSRRQVAVVFKDTTARQQSAQEREALLAREQQARAKTQASEELLRLVIDAIPLLVSFVTADERYRLVNHAYTDWFGLPPEQMVGHTVREVIGEAAYAALGPHVRRGLAGEHFSFEQHGVPYRRGGTRDVKVSFVPHRSAAGAVDGYVALLEDITERRRLEAERERLARQRDEALATLRVQAEFEQHLVGIVSHDLRNPLNAILLGAGALTGMENLDSTALRVASRIRSSAERAGRMIRDLLDFTQARLGGGIPIRPGPLDLHALVQQVVEEVETAHPGRDIHLQQEGDGRAEGDSDRLAQVVGNLLTNALKYSPPASLVRVTTRSRPGWFCLTVHNEGAPIAPAKLGSIFEPLQRATADVDRVGRSVGLGLYIVKHIVDAHGGAVDVSSTAADGTVFTVSLPRDETAPPAPPPG